MPSLKPFKPSPSPLPSSGSRFAPKSRNATTASTIRCHGCNKSPICILRAPLLAGPLSRYIVAQSRPAAVTHATRLRWLIHLRRIPQPLRHHVVKAAQVLFVPHSQPPVHLHQRKQP